MRRSRPRRVMRTIARGVVAASISRSICLSTFLTPLAIAADAPRAARSVHLFYTATEADWFYNELVVEQSTPGSFFTACGFSHGYFGMQELADGKKVVLFSVWDPGSQNDPKSVAERDRVEIVYKADDVRVKRFGGEGTGGQRFFGFPWKIGETFRLSGHFAVQGGKTRFAPFFSLL